MKGRSRYGVPVIALAFALRLYRLADANVWWDEGLAVWAARMRPLEIARWTSVDVHPPLYFWLLHVWRQFVGDTEFALRFLSVAAGTLTVVAVWYLARLLVPRQPWIAIGAALLLSVSRFSVWWSQEMRMYVFGGLFATLSLAFTVRLRRRFEWRAVVGYLVTTVTALWTLYLLAFLLVIEGLYWLWSLHSIATRENAGISVIRRWVTRWAGLQVIVLAAVVPWLAYALPRTRSWSVQEAFDPLLYAELYATLLTLGISTDVETYRLPMIVVLAITLVGMAGLVRQALRNTQYAIRPPDVDESTLVLLTLTLLVPPLIVWLITMLPRSFGYAPHPEARYLLPFAPPFSVLVALAVVGVARVFRRRRYAVVFFALGGLIVLGIAGWSLGDYYAERYRSDDYVSVALTLKAHKQPDDLVVLHSDDPWPVFAYHWPSEFEGTPHLQDATPGGADYFLSPLWTQHDAIWLVVNEDALRVDPQRHFEGWLADRAVAQHEWRFGSKRVVLFARTAGRADRLLALAPGFTPQPPPTSTAVGGLHLVGWEQPLHRLRAGDTAHLAAYVERQDHAGGEVSVALGNTPVAQATAEVPVGDGIARVPVHVRVPPDVPARTMRWYVTLRSGGRSATVPEGTVKIAPIALPLSTSQPERVTPEHAVDATFDEPAVVRLLGYDLDEPDGAGDTLRVTLHWEALATPTTSYKVFTHLINDQGRVETQRDGIPLDGERPTTTWRPGEVLVDTYTIPVNDVPTGIYTLKVGFYDPVTGDRLGPVRDKTGAVQTDDQVVLEEIEIR